MAQWPTTLKIGACELKLLVTNQKGEDVLKARLPLVARHPRALLTLLEGLALWSGEPIYAVISAGEQRAESWMREAWLGELWPPESMLVQYDIESVVRRRRPIEGMGDFRDVRRQLPLVWSR
jgi:hypothetical protein